MSQRTPATRILRTEPTWVCQEQLIAGLKVVPEEFVYGAYRTYQVPARKIKELTGLSFGSLLDLDTPEREEALLSHRRVDEFEEIHL